MMIIGLVSSATAAKAVEEFWLRILNFPLILVAPAKVSFVTIRYGNGSPSVTGFTSVRTSRIWLSDADWLPPSAGVSNLRG
jgi:hypothetical protein